MIVYKTSKVFRSKDGERMYWQGWYLFGFLPLYVRRYSVS